MRELEEFLVIIAEWTMVQRPSTVVGDFSYDFLRPFSAYDDFACSGDIVHTFLLEAGLYCLVESPTRGPNCLDAVLSNDLNHVDNCGGFAQFLCQR